MLPSELSFRAPRWSAPLDENTTATLVSAVPLLVTVPEAFASEYVNVLLFALTPVIVNVPSYPLPTPAITAVWPTENPFAAVVVIVTTPADTVALAIEYLGEARLFWLIESSNDCV